MEWFKEKWKIVTGIVVGIVVSLFTVFGMMIKSRNQKEVLENANELHKKENLANLTAMKDLDVGLSEIHKSKDESLDEINEIFENDLKTLAAKKDEIVKDAKEDEDLARKLADAIGADFVKTKD